MVDTKFEYTTSESPTLVQMATLTSDGNRSVSTGNALDSLTIKVAALVKKYIKLVTTYGKIQIKTVFKN